MSSLVRIAQTILGNEKAMELKEVNEKSPDQKGFHRYQVVTVVRDDNLAEFRTDMGSTKLWNGVREIRIPGLLEYTVDELKNVADELRVETTEQDLIDIKELLGMEIID